jgi:hypothetical protein
LTTRDQQRVEVLARWIAGILTKETDPGPTKAAKRYYVAAVSGSHVVLLLAESDALHALS